ncbi:Cysteine synthase [subsurface metagenome]
MTKYNNILETIGNTPIIKLNSIGNDLPADIYCKLESFNPGGSVKDRPALFMINAAEKAGLLNKQSHIVEPTSGNTGIGLALVCAIKGYQITLIMPESMSIERQKILKAYGANVILTPKETGMKGTIAKANELAKESSYVFIPQQFRNQENPESHRNTTAVEIWEDLNHNVDVFVSAVGTGGTITGVGEALKKFNPKIHVIAIEPIKSPILSGGKAGPHGIQGMGAGFIPEILNTKIYDEIIQITLEESIETSRNLAKQEGIFAGISSGGALAAALKYAEKANKAERIVVILPDTGERYLSTELWNL